MHSQQGLLEHFKQCTEASKHCLSSNMGTTMIEAPEFTRLALFLRERDDVNTPNHRTSPAMLASNKIKEFMKSKAVTSSREQFQAINYWTRNALPYGKDL